MESSEQNPAEVVNVRDMLFCIIARDSSGLYSCSMANLERLLWISVVRESEDSDAHGELVEILQLQNSKYRIRLL